MAPLALGEIPEEVRLDKLIGLNSPPQAKAYSEKKRYGNEWKDLHKSSEEMEREAYRRYRGDAAMFTPYELESRALRARDFEAFRKPAPMYDQLCKESTYDMGDLKGLSFDPRIPTKITCCSRCFDCCCCCCIYVCCPSRRRKKKRRSDRPSRESRDSLGEDARGSRASRASRGEGPNAAPKKRRCCLVRWLCCCCFRSVKRNTGPKFELGAEVECFYKKIGEYYPGRVIEITVDGLYVIEYDGGNVERRIKEELLRVPQEKPIEEEPIEAIEEEPAPAKDEPPAPAPPEPWEICDDEDGNPYYYNRDTGETSWTLPEAPPAPPKPPKRSWCFGTRKETTTLFVAADTSAADDRPRDQTLVVAENERPKAAASPPKRSWCFGRRKKTTTLVVASENSPEDNRLPEFPARLPESDDLVVEDF